MNKGMKILTIGLTAGLVASAGIAGGVAIAEEQAQTKYEQMLEEEKQSAVDEYKETINIGYSEEQVQERENVAREEGKQEGLTEGYENGYNQCLKDLENAGSEGGTSTSKNYESLMTGTYSLAFGHDDFAIIKNSDGMWVVNKATDTFKLLKVTIDGTEQNAIRTNQYFYNNETVVVNVEYSGGIRLVSINFETLEITTFEEGAVSEINSDIINLELTDGTSKELFVRHVSFNGTVHSVITGMTAEMFDMTPAFDSEIEYVSWQSGNIEPYGSKVESVTDTTAVFSAAFRHSSTEDGSELGFVAIRFTYNLEDGTYTTENLGMTSEEWETFRNQ